MLVSKIDGGSWAPPEVSRPDLSPLIMTDALLPCKTQDLTNNSSALRKRVLLIGEIVLDNPRGTLRVDPEITESSRIFNHIFSNCRWDPRWSDRGFCGYLTVRGQVNSRVLIPLVLFATGSIGLNVPSLKDIYSAPKVPHYTGGI